jgi:hypothetical protein
VLITTLVGSVVAFLIAIVWFRNFAGGWLVLAPFAVGMTAFFLEIIERHRDDEIMNRDIEIDYLQQRLNECEGREASSEPPA